MGCTVYAIGGMPDHVHLVVRMPGRLSPAALMKQVKGASSVLLNEVRPEFSERFDWQDGYGCLSIGQSRDELETVIAYVRRQKEHHANNDLMLDWEETNELVPEDDEINTLRNTVR
jgi:putative transposase